MALDKQRILSELGSVVNQLQSAECGCMGKLFSDSNQGSSMGTPMQSCGGCRMGCCHGQGAPFSGEPYSPMNNQCMNRQFMGNCNPPKLYAETYGYLNKNLMQPIVNEVYNDLKSISPENTVMNNPMANKMGLPSANPAMAGQNNISGMPQNPMVGGNMNNPDQGGDMPGMTPGYQVGMANMNASPQMGRQNQYMGQMDQPMGQSIGHPMGQMNKPMGQMNQSMGQMNQSMGQMNQSMGQMNQPMGQMNQQMGQMNQPMDQPMGQMGGMGSQIMKMMMGDKTAKPANMPVQNGQLTDSMLIDAPQSPHGAVGVTPLRQGTYGTNVSSHNPNYALDHTGAYVQNPTSQHMTPNNSYTANPMLHNNNLQQNNLPLNNMVQNNMTPNSGDAVQNMAGAGQMTGNRYGQHTQGMKKFSEMFPGVMKGDLGFDPMAIAIQMNPANQQQAAMNTMQKLMTGNKVMNASGNNSVLQPAINSTNAANANIVQSGSPQLTQQSIPNQAPVQNQIQPAQQQQLQQVDPNAAVPINQVPQQQVYTAGSSPQYQQSPAQQYHQPPPQQYRQPQQYQSQAHMQQQFVDPNTGAVMDSAPTLAGGHVKVPNPNMQQDMPQSDAAHLKEMIMEPIFPADTSKNQAHPTYSHHVKQPRNYYYNTLGQPVHMLDAKAYRPVEPPLPQTLSPQSIKPRSNPQTFSNVKNTVSKTSILGNSPVGRTPSRSQLQHLYNQYKGSHSYTQQNVNAPMQLQTHSEGKINENFNSARAPPVPVERFGGDTIANNIVVNQEINKSGEPSAPMGDVVPVNKPEGDGAMDKVEPIKFRKGRNGLQDMVYTSSPTSAAWSFHGDNSLPYSTGYRFRTRIR